MPGKQQNQYYIFTKGINLVSIATASCYNTVIKL